jgi:hypothetical protein
MAALTGALLGLTALNTIQKFASDRRNATAAQQQGDYQAGIFGQDASLADQQATDAIARGHESELKSRGSTRLLTGTQRADLAAQGISLDSGSAADIIDQDRALGELDALQIRNNARREAWGFQTQAAQYRSQADMARVAGRNTAAAYRNQSVNTLLSGASDLFSTYQSFGMNRAPTASPTAGQYGASPFKLPRSYYPRY